MLTRLRFLGRMKQPPPTIVVVGGGAGGLELVTTLGNTLGKPGLAKIYLTDGEPAHIWKPLLHEMSTGTLNVGEDEVNYFTHAFHNGYKFHYGWMNGLDREHKLIEIGEILDTEGNVIHGPRKISYDTLILAIGARTNSFGTPGVRDHCLTLDSQAESERLRKRFLAYALALAFKKIDRMKIGIVGAGPTGVELAAEIHHKLSEIHSYGATITQDQLEISVIEAAPTILPGTLPHMPHIAAKELKKRGIKVLTNSKIKEVNEKGFVFADGTTLEADIKIWSAGIKAPNWLSKIGLQVDGINRIKTSQFLTSIDDPSIHVIGDCAHVKCPNDPTRTMPATAQCAHQEAEWLAKKIINDFKGKKTKKPFMFNSQGMLVSLGHTTAVGTMQPPLVKINYRLSGRSAKFLYSTLYRMHQAAVYGHLKAACILIGDKLRGLTIPSVKLH